MRLVLALVAGLALLGGNAQAQQPLYDQAQLDSMLAPIALQPDGVVSQVLIAATYPDEVSAAAAWARANPHMRGDAALRAVQNEPWDPAVKALVAFPELLIRMDESPHWMRDLGQAFIHQQAQVMDTVQGLRRRAQASGNLASTDHYSVTQQGEAIVVEPRSQIVYVRYYDPYVVYGPWWWPHYYYPVYWHPWVPRPVFISHGFWYAKPHWHHGHVHVVHKPVHAHHHAHHVVPGKWQPKHIAATAYTKPHVRVPESQRQPIVQQHTQMPAASGFTHQPQRNVGAGQARPQGGGNEARQQGGGREVRSAPVRQGRSSIGHERSAAQARDVGQARAVGQVRSFGQERSFGFSSGGQHHGNGHGYGRGGGNGGGRGRG